MLAKVLTWLKVPLPSLSSSLLAPPVLPLPSTIRPSEPPMPTLPPPATVRAAMSIVLVLLASTLTVPEETIALSMISLVTALLTITTLAEAPAPRVADTLAAPMFGLIVMVSVAVTETAPGPAARRPDPVRSVVMVRVKPVPGAGSASMADVTGCTTVAGACSLMATW